MPAQHPRSSRRRIRIAKNSKPGNFRGLVILGVTSVLVVLVVLFLISVNKAYHGKYTVAVNGRDFGLIVSTFDFDSQDITSVSIPSNTILIASRQLGTWKAGSIWQLSINEKAEGVLVQETVVKNFHLPIDYWADSQALGFTGNSLPAAIRSGLVTYPTNLSASQKISIALLRLKIGEANIKTINLGKTSYLTDAKLPDGTSGYRATEVTPDILFPVYFETAINSGSLKAVIKDNTAVPGLVENVAKTIEMLGIKVTSIDRNQDNTMRTLGNYECGVSGLQTYIIAKIARIFNCKPTFVHPDGNFDVELVVPETFAEKY